MYSPEFQDQDDYGREFEYSDLDWLEGIPAVVDMGKLNAISEPVEKSQVFGVVLMWCVMGVVAWGMFS